MQLNKDKEVLINLFTERFGFDPDVFVALPGAGSNRRYYRLSGNGVSCIGVGCSSEQEACAFVSLAWLFRSKGISVPEVYASTPDSLHYIQQDLGDISLFSLLSGESVRSLIEVSLQELARLQCTDEREWRSLVFNGRFGARQAMWDLNYFRYSYLNVCEIAYDEVALDDDFMSLAKRIDAIDGKKSGFMYRDCQSRNVMTFNGEPYWIDFQGGRKGPALYDAVSFLWQAKAGFPDEFRRDMLDVYAAAYCGIRGIDREDFLSDLQPLVVLRTLQVLGAYGFRGLVQHKAHFIDSINGALANVRDLLAEGAFDAYPELNKVMRRVVSDNRFNIVEPGDGLHVRVQSFSFKKGYPDDFTGNGGGFVFDCRGMHNPGRYAEYKTKTGRDAEVIEFLEERGECGVFIERALALVRPTVERYIARGFTELQLNFGCTGGQHRSVYCAEKMADAIANLYPETTVTVSHREQSIPARQIEAKKRGKIQE